MSKKVRAAALTALLIAGSASAAKGPITVEGGCWSISIGPIFITNCY